MFLPFRTLGRNAVAACMLVNHMLPMLLLLVNPKTAFAVLNVTFLDTLSAILYI